MSAPAHPDDTPVPPQAAPPQDAPISRAELEHLAQLCRLDLQDDEKTGFLDDLNRMLGYFRQLQALDTEGVPEMQRPVQLVNVLRADEPGELFTQAEVLALAPEAQDGFIRVPRTVEQ